MYETHQLSATNRSFAVAPMKVVWCYDYCLANDLDVTKFTVRVQQFCKKSDCSVRRAESLDR